MDRAADRAAAERELRAIEQRLRKPLDDIFNLQLKPRLAALLTDEQRAR